MAKKRKRKQNKPSQNYENLDHIRSLACSICGHGPSDPHHWRGRGAGGKDDLTNLISLCRTHHRLVHDIGKKTFWRIFKKAIKQDRKENSLPDLELGFEE